MGDTDAMFLTAEAAARRIGVCAKTFKKMLAKIPATKRPRFEAPPGMSRPRYRRADIDSAFAAASASSGWDRKLEDGGHAKTKRVKRVG